MNPLTYILNDELVVNIEGEFDAYQVSQLRDEFEFYSQGERNIIVDISLVNFIDSSGIGALVFLYKRLIARDYTLTIVGAQGQVAELFTMLHLNRSIKCSDSIKQYLAESGNDTLVDHR